jgi:hypothetical protein
MMILEESVMNRLMSTFLLCIVLNLSSATAQESAKEHGSESIEHLVDLAKAHEQQFETMHLRWAGMYDYELWIDDERGRYECRRGEGGTIVIADGEHWISGSGLTQSIPSSAVQSGGGERMLGLANAFRLLSKAEISNFLSRNITEHTDTHVSIEYIVSEQEKLVARYERQGEDLRTKSYHEFKRKSTSDAYRESRSYHFTYPVVSENDRTRLVPVQVESRVGSKTYKASFELIDINPVFDESLFSMQQ